MSRLSKPRVLLLNPPARKPVLRDYYCSTFPKAFYYWQPVDLLCLAALLQDRTEIRILDAVSQKLSPVKSLEAVRAFAPQAVFSLVSTLTRKQDLAFLRRVSSMGARIVLGGETALDPDFDFSRYPFVNGLILDFTSQEAADFILGRKALGRVRTPEHAPDPPPLGQRYSLGITPHHLMDNSLHRLPLWHGGFHSLLTDFGCPHQCPFCNSGKNSLGFKTRDLREVSRELDLLRSLGARRIYLRDMTFGADPDHGRAVLDMLAKHDFSLRGYTRAAQVTADWASRLKRAGFDMVQIGIERPTSSGRRSLGKNLEDDVVEQAFRLLKEQGIRAGAHFMVGFAKESPMAAWYCAALASRLGASYCSINVHQPRLGAPFRPGPAPARRLVFSAFAKAAMAAYNAPRLARFVLHESRSQ